jgi:uncharacterized membrane protein
VIHHAAVKPTDAVLPIAEPAPVPRRRRSFGEDFRQFFTRGLAALMPTLITLTIVFWIFDFLWDKLGQHLIHLIKLAIWQAGQWGWIAEKPVKLIDRTILVNDALSTKLLGVALAIVAVYVVGLLIGNLLGRTFWAIAERAVNKIPVVRAIYPAVKQVSDFVLREKSQQFQASRVVAVKMHHSDVWSVGLVTGDGLASVDSIMAQPTVTVFIPSSPTSFSGYVVVVPRSSLIELPIATDEAMRMLVSGGVLTPARAAEPVP